MRLAKNLKTKLVDEYKHSLYRSKQIEWGWAGASFVYSFTNYDKRITAYDKLCELGLMACIDIDFNGNKQYIITRKGTLAVQPFLKEYLLTKDKEYQENAIYTYGLNKFFLEDIHA